MEYLPKYFTSKAIGLYIVALLSCSLLFWNHALPLIWIVFGLVEVFTFFHFSNTLTKRWTDLSEKTFQKKIFWTALWIRLVYVVAIYFFYQYMTGEPFEFSTKDAKGYHDEAIWLIDLFKSHQLRVYFEYAQSRYSDIGFPVYLSFFHYFFGSTLIIPRLVNALLGAWTCIIIYKLSYRNFGEAAARITAILAMLLPNLIYYCGLHLKETLMVFLVLVFIEGADRQIRLKKLTFSQVLVTVLSGLSVFFFRTVLAASIWFALICALIFSSERITVRGRRIIIVVWIAAALWIVYSSNIRWEVEKSITNRKTDQPGQMAKIASGAGGNKLAKYGSASFFSPVVIAAPIPTLVNIKEQENAMMLNGAIYTRNVYSFFVFLALVLLIKRKIIRRHILILSALIMYLTVLVMSGFALSERFHLPAVPFLLILAGYGITQVDLKNKKYYIPYLVLVFFLIVGWNWFKLAGRGMIE